MVNIPDKEPSNVVSWRVFDDASNLFLGLIAFFLLCSGNWELGIPALAIVAFYVLSGVLKRRKKKKIWPLALQGNPDAQFEMGNIFARGEVVTKNYPEALKWYRKAADKGYAKALDRVSAWHAGGHGTPIDNVEAYFWLLLAKKYGATKTFLDSERMEKYLKPDQIAAVEKRVAEWKPTK